MFNKTKTQIAAVKDIPRQMRMMASLVISSFILALIAIAMSVMKDSRHAN